MMDGRVKTLHPALHGGILARRDRPDDLDGRSDATASAPVDVVVVNLYPFVETAANPGDAFDELVEEIDIGGPSHGPRGGQELPGCVRRGRPGATTARCSPRSTRRRPDARIPVRLTQKAFAHTAAYDTAIAATLAGRLARRRHVPRATAPAAGACRDGSTSRLTKVRDLRYGENPHQQAAWYGAGRWRPASGTRDGAAGQGAVATPTCSTWTPRRASRSSSTSRRRWSSSTRTRAASRPAQSTADAYVRAREADPLSAFGGIVGLNRPIDERRRARPSRPPSSRPSSRREPTKRRCEVLGGQERRCASSTADFRPLARGGGGAGRDRELRSILGALLVQDRDRVAEAQQPWAAEALPEGLRVVDDARRRPPRSGRRCASPGASART